MTVRFTLIDDANNDDEYPDMVEGCYNADSARGYYGADGNIHYCMDDDSDKDF